MLRRSIANGRWKILRHICLFFTVLFLDQWVIL
uniref:Uncharacterized protein n=1 Tax=Arundo donax TaxID=35708 RepID=A0A0A8ZTD1_ARUDO